MNFNSPPSTPVQAMQAWFDEAVELQTTPNPLAMALSTVNAEGRPSSRMVLLKGFDAGGAVLYTNYKSAKANEIAANSMVSLLVSLRYHAKANSHPRQCNKNFSPRI